MKAKDLAKQLLKNPDFDVIFNIIDNGGSLGFSVKEFRNIDITDIVKKPLSLVVKRFNHCKK